MLEFPIFRISFLLRFECSRDTVFFFPGRQGISGTRHVVVSVRFVSDRVHGLWSITDDVTVLMQWRYNQYSCGQLYAACVIYALQRNVVTFSVRTICFVLLVCVYAMESHKRNALDWNWVHGALTLSVRQYNPVAFIKLPIFLGSNDLSESLSQLKIGSCTFISQWILSSDDYLTNGISSVIEEYRAVPKLSSLLANKNKSSARLCSIGPRKQ